MSASERTHMRLDDASRRQASRVRRYDAVRKAVSDTLLDHQRRGLLRFMPREQTIDDITEAVLERVEQPSTPEEQT